jgi:outer membrane protein assembly factor BamE (lipoprotein component of BamABCDE complex)
LRSNRSKLVVVFIITVSLLLFALLLAGCGKSSSGSSDTSTETKGTSTETRDTSTPRKALLGHWVYSAGELYFSDNKIWMVSDYGENTEWDYTVTKEDPKQRTITIEDSASTDMTITFSADYQAAEIADAESPMPLNYVDSQQKP